MDIYHTFKEIPKEKPLVLAMGFFDGCHRGHQAVFQAACKLAEEKNGCPGILTFWPHPMAVLAPHIHVPLLQSREEKMKSMEEAGMKAALLLYPDKEFLMKSPEAFMEDLRSIPPLVGLVTGENFTFGKGAAGRASMLLQHFTGTPVAVKVVSLQNEMEGAVSSTLIRKHIMEGEMEKASMLLGRNYTTAGEVVHGFQRGSGLLGFPTANMRLREDRVIPPDGVYATRAGVNGRVYPAVTNVGKNPTFGNRERTIETFIFHFDESIYGRPFYLEWVSRLRGEVRFSSIGALKQQIEKDIVRAESILGR